MNVTSMCMLKNVSIGLAHLKMHQEKLPKCHISLLNNLACAPCALTSHKVGSHKKNVGFVMEVSLVQPKGHKW